MASGWSAWRPLAGAPAMPPAVLAETLDGGQAFRWHRQSDDSWLGVWGDCIAQIQRDPDGCLVWRAPAPLAPRVAAALPHYLGLDRDFAALADSLPRRSDAHLAQCLAAFPGLRILRQPFGETLLGFLCSATKQIVQIKQMLALLAERHGRPVAERVSVSSSGENRTVSATLHALPTWPELATIPESDLRACLLGFRSRYISQTAQFLAAHPGWLEETEATPYPLAKERLCSLPGVGEKIADCVLLFGAGRLEAFPVDTWILQALARRYGLDGWKPAQVAQFGRAHFGPLAGLAQQYLFAYERAARDGTTLDQSQRHGQK
ncbi:MAG: DNA-binding protein [Opitutaceae bacterium]|nr:DNA-binding protein [Opitutaceae bacterium]